MRCFSSATKDAYDYLMTAPSIKVWDEGKRQYGANSNPGSSGFPDVGNAKPKPNAMRREVRAWVVSCEKVSEKGC